MLQEELDNSDSVLKSLLDLYTQGELVDVSLSVGTKLLRTHKLVLCMRSDVFKTMLTSGSWPESRSSTITLQEEPECEAVFENFLKYMYSGRITLNKSSVLPLLMLADKYNVPDLSTSCLTYISSNCLPEAKVSIMAWLEYAVMCGNSRVEHICLAYILSNFESVINTKEFVSLSQNILVKLLKSSELVISNEYSLYKAITKWLLANQNESATDDTDTFLEIMQYIRFPMMSLQQLSHLETDQFVKSHQDFFLKRIFCAMKYHTNTNPNYRRLLIASQLDEDQYYPRNYCDETWSTTVVVEDFDVRLPGDVCGAFFTTPISCSETDKFNLRDWHIHLYPKGIKFDPCIMIGVPSSISVSASFEKNIRISVSTKMEVKQSVKIIVLVIADRQDQDEFVCKVLSMRAIFDETCTMFNINHIVPYEELICSDSKYLVSKYNQFKLIIIIKPDTL